MKRTIPSIITSALLAAICLAATSGPVTATSSPEQGPITLKTMGSLFFGGTVTRADNGETFHGDHGYAQYYIPERSRDLPLVMWHGIGQSGKTFESTPDGREGFQAILTRRDWPVYIIDQPRRGRAGRTRATPSTTDVPTVLRESSAWNAFRLGLWIPPQGPSVFPNVQLPMDGYTVDQFFRQQTPDTGEEPRTADYRRQMGRTVSELFQMTGPGVLITHSNSGQYGWEAAMAQPDLVRAVIGYEPGAYAFPEGERPADIPSGIASVNEGMQPRMVPMDEFLKLTRMPILVVYGDNIATEQTDVFNSEVWRIASARGKQFVDAVNRHGGDARIVLLPDLGIKGNTHIPFADMNNLEIARQLEAFLEEKGLAGRDAPHQGPRKHVMDLTIPLESASQ